VFSARRNHILARLVLALAGTLFLQLSAAGGAFHSTPSNSAGPGSTNAAEGILKQMLAVRQTGSNTYRLGRVEFNKTERTVSIPARVRMRKDVVEYGLVTEQGKGYESLLTTEARPMDIHVACLLLGQQQVPVTGDVNKPAVVPATNAVLIEVSWETNSRPVRVPFADLVCVTSGRPDPNAPVMKLERWLYNGSLIDQAGFAAQREGSIISLIRDPVALVNNPCPDRDNDDIHFPNAKLLPGEGTAVTVIIHCL
jgi:hypothetical protein